MTLKWCPQVGRRTVLRLMTVQMRLTVWRCCVTDRTNGPILRLISWIKRGIRSLYRLKRNDLLDCATAQCSTDLVKVDHQRCQAPVQRMYAPNAPLVSA
jgi:hypothetical protein